MKFDISGNPAYGDLTVALEPGESIWAESGAMSRMSGNLEMDTKLVGGFLKAVIRKLLGGESLFVGQYTATERGFISMSPGCPGSVVHRTMKEGETFNLTAGAFLACTAGMTLKTKFGGLKAFFSGEGAFFVEVEGVGDLFFNCYGGLVEKEIDGELTVDTGHLVAWEPSLEYTIGGMGGLKSTLFSGEGLVMNFSGKGKIWLQTRYLGGMAGWLGGYC